MRKQSAEQSFVAQLVHFMYHEPCAKIWWQDKDSAALVGREVKLI